MGPMSSIRTSGKEANVETRQVPPGYEMLDLVLKFLEILYVGKVGTVVMTTTPRFLLDPPRRLCSSFSCEPFMHHHFHADDLAAQTNTPALDERQCECLDVGVRLSEVRRLGMDLRRELENSALRRKETREVRCL
jgi:hypothetical protein